MDLIDKIARAGKIFQREAKKREILAIDNKREAYFNANKDVVLNDLANIAKMRFNMDCKVILTNDSSNDLESKKLNAFVIKDYTQKNKNRF
ncbi:hypothetical protein DCO58_01835 [Helicobacter saguini]|uniref:Uncharacterized protein n=1 Tax=Helicobacter saguini TaxID=1548018 RepID=A0A347VRJ4_9HELI|nr:hypothetical protein [Helicobacter saguini]MWV62878.1 hypothetical protein [Helicobacter saguini]MWV66452.1 hypothetical protein [Helicobacter saguini]MWV68801.1 hypothetical protein [Helicobacter saguini]MWV71644.1 hypothetical protein [Helicobacter saguini]TLD94447.1 hypothetical protein LS64_005835 [Helicobacter saguini]